MNKSESPTLRELREQNKNTAAEVVDYRKIADEVGMSWNGVKYAVSALIRYGFIKKEDGKLSVNPSSPEVVVN